MILYIDTASNNTQVSFLKEDQVYLESLSSEKQQSKNILSMIESLLVKSRSQRQDIKFIAFNSGPGYFTGLRIGLSCAQALSTALNVPIFPISSFQALGLTLYETNKTMPIGVAIDARMNEVYWCSFNKFENIFLSYAEKQILSIDEFSKKLDSKLYDNGNICGNAIDIYINNLSFKNENILHEPSHNVCLPVLKKVFQDKLYNTDNTPDIEYLRNKVTN
ncbi:MAG: tRNA (adenosine(37)-N6)-threonylcarbamoyltransferase complex dimerization subunit type 1 TsaB [Pseudomonadota bacterium]|nr:tRNA (adenosine(37)-N6)-threonylcarbamoyltransferase complex dimerization subunit type 1 TsaB [Pseudomonadota bacterium]